MENIKLYFNREILYYEEQKYIYRLCFTIVRVKYKHQINIQNWFYAELYAKTIRIYITASFQLEIIEQKTVTAVLVERLSENRDRLLKSDWIISLHRLRHGFLNDSLQVSGRPNVTAVTDRIQKETSVWTTDKILVARNKNTVNRNVLMEGGSWVRKMYGKH